jgi:hypothetical protein
VAHRRFGKTVFAIGLLIRRAIPTEKQHGLTAGQVRRCPRDAADSR